jgi:hypothetical protein
MDGTGNIAVTPRPEADPVSVFADISLLSVLSDI